MNFIHAVVFDVDEFNNGSYDTTNWGDLTSGDYIVHCLYNLDNQEILMLNDNCHSSIEANIEAFLEGVEFCGHDAIVERACVVVDNGLSYDMEAVELCLIAGNYVEVME